MTAEGHFDLLNSPLEGTNLIEASAGTGKTFTITGLFLRLVLEKDLSVDQILVVTFTEAATEELKGRIREKLKEAHEAFTGVGTEDPFLEALAQKHADAHKAANALEQALHSFDQAAVSTIHGFCMRVLHEFAFESGDLFDTELVTDQEELQRDVVADFWRKHFTTGTPLFVRYALGRGYSIDALLSLLSLKVLHPHLKVIPEVDTPGTSRQEAAFMGAFEDARTHWERSRDEVQKILTEHEDINRTRYPKKKIPEWIECMDGLMKAEIPDPQLFRDFEKFTSGNINASLKRHGIPPTHPFFDRCQTLKRRQEELIAVFERRLMALKSQLFHYAERILSELKEEKNIHSFDDLLLKLHKALLGRGGEDLQRAIREKFRAALIDEFQDTDPVQYAIFKRIFGSRDSILFLVGDPKQAIYSFRGADIFTYMEAARDVATRYDLKENWRSDPLLIKAINALFSQNDLPFVYDEIPYRPTAPAQVSDRDSLRLDGKEGYPFQIWFLDAGKLAQRGRPISKTQAREILSAAVSAEISRLVTLGRKGRAHLGGRPLSEQDIAILVRTNSEAALMQEALSALHIPSVLYSSGNLFDSLEALEVERVLAGVAAPNDKGRLRAALATGMMGMRGEELEALDEDQAEAERWIVRFWEYHDLWTGRGFIRMFRSLLFQEHILEKLMRFQNGERRCTNLLHLGEVLHQAVVEKRLGMDGLLKWLSEKRNRNAPRLEEHQLRLESDENAVRIVTIHRSKGLEYPVIFCPFLWEGSRFRGRNKPFTFHDPADNMLFTLDLGSQNRDKNIEAAEKELLAENLRLLYVAVTRAKNRCYIAWGRFNEAETSAPAYLFHPPRTGKRGNLLSAVEKEFKSLADEDLLRGLKVLAQRAQGAIGISAPPIFRPDSDWSPPEREEESLACREFSTSIDTRWQMTSFSSLTSGFPHAVEVPDRDELQAEDDMGTGPGHEPDVEEPPRGIFAFPKGARAGTFLHDLMERLDFTCKEPVSIETLVEERLAAYGYDPGWREEICRMVNCVLSTPLEEGSELRLSSIPVSRRLNELEFYFPLREVSSESLKEIFSRHSTGNIPCLFPETIGRLQFAPVRGFMRGFMDLVFQWQERFYLVDWKSNHLGNRIRDYAGASVTRSMEENSYVLQYHIYILALDQYLRHRLPGYRYEKHFGGVFYLFLRGIDPDMGPGYGIYRDLPPPGLIQDMRQKLMDVP